MVRIDLVGALEPVVAYTDGSGTVGDQPAGIGAVVLVPGRAPVLHCSGIGLGSNNRAELVAIMTGAVMARGLLDRPRPILVRSDSQWAIGACTRDWQLRSHRDLVALVRGHLEGVVLEHVRGHAGDLWNEVADRLARAGRLGEPPRYPRSVRLAIEALGASYV